MRPPSPLGDDAIARLRDAAVRPDLASGRYELGELIGRGGMGAVYSARDRLLDRDVALKVAHTVIGGPAHDGSVGRAAQDRSVGDAAQDRSVGSADLGVETESRILARLEHPGIVPIHDAGVTADGRVFYAMKLVRGKTLTAHIAGVPDLSARLSIFERIVEAVAFAHAAGVVHRDLSPANVMIGGFGEVLVLDWGVAELLAGDRPHDDSPHDRQDKAGLRIGTRGFMAPEHADAGGTKARPTSDVFSMGAILSMLLTGLSAPKRLSAIAAKCRHADPALRYPDGAALAGDLARFRAGQPVTAYRDTLVDHAAAWFGRYGVFVALVLAYLVMRAAVAILAGR